MTQPDILNLTPDLETYFKQFLAQHISMARRKIDDGMHVSQLSLSHRRFKLFLFRAKKQMQLSNNVTCNDLFVNENLITLN